VRLLRALLVSGLIATTLMLGLTNSIAVASSLDGEGPQSPVHWPKSSEVAPQLSGWPNAARLWGINRYDTGLAISLALRGSGGFPFSTPDGSSGGVKVLKNASGWWGLDRCPRSVIIVAGDSPADAMAATSLSDSTGLSTEPYLRRTASADPLFDPVGGYQRVDTDSAPLLITASARSGARALSTAAKLAVQDLRNGGCRTARQAIIVGGTNAVPAEVDSELLSIGINEIFRIQGIDRFATAALVARSLGTAAVPETVGGCRDVSAIDGNLEMSFYANSVVEWRKSPDKCELLGNSVVLTDGITGADAVAAGWWTSYWQVPVLLHDGSGTLPDATVAALQTLNVANIIVLGGASRVPQTVVFEAKTLTGASSLRVSGTDRYATSVAMAEQFGGWWDTGRGQEFRASTVCVASYGGSGSNARGWPDALGAGAWCGTASAIQNRSVAPSRALTPIIGRFPRVAIAPKKSGHTSVPLLLVDPSKSALPDSVASFLARTFEPADSWCSSVISGENCVIPGFSVIFGGPESISEGLAGAISSAVAGGSSAKSVPSNPVLTDPFMTDMSMTPIYREAGTGEILICVPRNGIEQARWLVAGRSENPSIVSAVDVIAGGWYVSDNDGVNRSTGVSAPGCLRIAAAGSEQIWVRAVGIDGRVSASQYLKVASENRFKLSSSVIVAEPALAEGLSTSVDLKNGGRTVLSYFEQLSEVRATYKGVTAPLASTSLTFNLNRGLDGITDSVDAFDGAWHIDTSEGGVVGQVTGEALRVGPLWFLRGVSTVAGGSWQSSNGRGAFSAEINVGAPGLQDDRIIWNIDAADLKPRS
jgi:putative cell wall-binding protein